MLTPETVLLALHDRAQQVRVRRCSQMWPIEMELVSEDVELNLV